MDSIGVFFCRCRGEIGNNLDLDEIKNGVKHLIAHSSIHNSLCSSEGYQHIKDSIQKDSINAVVIAACSPTHYEAIFRDLTKEVGVNPGKLGFANIREHSAWVHSIDKDEATKKASVLTSATIESIKHSKPFELKKIPAKRSVTIIGGGVAGTRIASRFTELDYEVHLVEKSPFLGGTQLRFSKTFPRDECSFCALSPTISKVLSSKNVKVHTFSEVTEVKGRVGDYKVTIHERPRYVDPDKCTFCGKCQKACVQEIGDEFNFSLVSRKAIYMPTFDIHPRSCFINESTIDFCVNECTQPCVKACPSDAINFNDKLKEYEISTGAIVTAMGYDTYKPKLGEFGYGSPDVMTLEEYERLLAADGIFDGEIKKLSDEKSPETMAFVLCVGSRQRDAPYCSVYCCLATASAVRQTRHKLPDSRIYVFYRDLFASGKFGDEYLKMTQQLPNTEWIRNIPEYNENNGQKYLKISIGGGSIDLPVDQIVLATGIKPKLPDSDELRVILGLERTPEGFFREEDILLNPVATHDKGKFLAGACLGPRTITQAISDADSVVTSITSLLGEAQVRIPVFISEVDEELCGMCNTCVKTCLFHAASIDEGRMLSIVDESLCRGCGNCVTACPTGARDLLYYNNEYFRSHIDILSKYQPPNGGKKVLAFLCKSCGYEAADNIGLSGNSYPLGFMIVRAPCTGRIDTQFVLEAFEKGFDGVFVGGCHENSCAYIGGNYDLERRIDMLNPLLLSTGINPERVKVIWTSPMEIRRFDEEINNFFVKLDSISR